MTRVLMTWLLAGAAALAPEAATQSGVVELGRTLERAGLRVEDFFTRAQSLICTETVTMQPLNSSLVSDGFSRTVKSELRVSWDPGDEGPVTEAQIRRQVITVNGRPPRDKDHRSCTTPEQTESEPQPLSMLLPAQRIKYEFSSAGRAQIDGRASLLIDYREVAPVGAEVRAVDGLDDCISYDLTGGQRGRLWIDAETFDVLRLDQRLIGMVELRLPRVLARRPGSPGFMTLERADTSIRFARVPFTDPDESLVLPSSASELRVMRGGGASRLRTMTRYSDYKRFMTGTRVVGAADF